MECGGNADRLKNQRTAAAHAGDGALRHKRAFAAGECDPVAREGAPYKRSPGLCPGSAERREHRGREGGRYKRAL